MKTFAVLYNAVVVALQKKAQDHAWIIKLMCIVIILLFSLQKYAMR